MTSSNANQCCCVAGEKKCIWGKIHGILKLITQVAKIAVFTGLTLVLFDVHHGIKTEFQNMPQQANMTGASATPDAGS